MVQGIITLVLILLFIAGWIAVWSPKRMKEFDEASRLPLEEDEMEKQA